MPEVPMSQRRPFPVLLLVVLSHPALAQQPARSVIAVKARSEVETAAARIDSLVEQGLQRAGQQPNPTIDDATFVRRAYLANVGRIPTLRECEAFLADQGTDKRGQLIDELLDAPGHVSSESNFWADLLRARSRLMRQVSGEPFLQWIKDALVQDLPYDRMVTEMLTATGAANERGKGATGFLLRDLNMPHDAMANTLRVFLGTRLECAQCHNHPFDKWTQKQFYEMAAFFGGLQYRANLGATALGQELRATAREADDKQKQLVRRIAQQIGVGLQGSGNGQEHLPADYKYDDSKP
ncbi:MAG TPA: DUF1549 domain-containing protein, partial [Planctomycetota bacterium]|nr:DUF1549 domain-containing protein [Planctomycetota bacterium]